MSWATYMTFETEVGIFAKQLRQLGVNIAWVARPSTATQHGSQARRSSTQRLLYRVRLQSGLESGGKGVAFKYEEAYKSAPRLPRGVDLRRGSRACARHRQRQEPGFGEKIRRQS